MWVAIHMCMEAMLGISQYSKNAMSFILSLMFPFQQNWRTRGQNRFCPDVGFWWVGAVAQIMYTHASKCKNNKIKERKIKIDLFAHQFSR
jgi:hypothetical protein